MCPNAVSGGLRSACSMTLPVPYCSTALMCRYIFSRRLIWLLSSFSWYSIIVLAAQSSSLRSHAGIFFCVRFWWFIRIKYSITCFFQQKPYYFQYINTLVVGNTPYGKRYISGTEPVLLQAWHIILQLPFAPIFFVQVPDQFDAFFNPKKGLSKDAKNITPSIWSTWKTYEFSRHRCCSALNFGNMATTYVPTDSSIWRSPAFREARAPQRSYSG